MRKAVCLLLPLALAALPAPLFAQAGELAQFRARQLASFSSAGHAKSQGLSVSLRYPAAWIAEEGERPHVVQKFSARPRPVVCTFLISDTGRNRTPAQARADLAPANLPRLVPDIATWLGGSQVRLDGLAAGEIQFATVTARPGVTIHMRSVGYVVYYGRHEIDLMCSVAANAAEGLDARFAAWLPVFRQIANTFVLHNQYQR